MTATDKAKLLALLDHTWEGAEYHNRLLTNLSGANASVLKPEFDELRAAIEAIPADVPTKMCLQCGASMARHPDDIALDQIAVSALELQSRLDTIREKNANVTRALALKKQWDSWNQIWSRKDSILSGILATGNDVMDRAAKEGGIHD